MKREATSSTELAHEENEEDRKDSIALHSTNYKFALLTTNEKIGTDDDVFLPPVKQKFHVGGENTTNDDEKLKENNETLFSTNQQLGKNNTDALSSNHMFGKYNTDMVLPKIKEEEEDSLLPSCYSNNGDFHPNIKVETGLTKKTKKRRFFRRRPWSSK